MNSNKALWSGSDDSHRTIVTITQRDDDTLGISFGALTSFVSVVDLLHASADQGDKVRCPHLTPLADGGALWQHPSAPLGRERLSLSAKDVLTIVAALECAPPGVQKQAVAA